MDLLGSILNSMDKPPSCSEKQKMLRKSEFNKKERGEQKEEFLKRQKQEKEVLKKFREDVEKKLSDFLKNNSLTKFEFEPVDKVFRSVIHDAAEIAGVAAFTIGEEDVDRRVIVYKKEFSPCEEELAALRRGEEWDPEKAKLLANQREVEKKEEEERLKQKSVQPATNYMNKYSHLIGVVAAKDAAQKTQMNKQYGFVPSENKRDQRSIEQTLADIQSKKKLKASHPQC